MPLVKLIDITPNAMSKAVYIARVSSSDQNNPDTERLIRYCLKKGHWSVFEHCHATVEVNTSRMISPQILRHWSMRFQEFSQRYQAVDESGIVLYAARRQDTKDRQNSIDDLPAEIKAEWLRRQQENWERAFGHYVWAIDNEIAKECARAVLPLQTATRLYMTGDLRSWITYLRLRCGKVEAGVGTQLEHKEIANAIKRELAVYLPLIAEVEGWLNDT